MTNRQTHSPSWGRLNNHARKSMDFDPSATLPGEDTSLPYGNGRSYGDSCHNEGGTLLLQQHRNRVISFDEQTGILIAEAGILITDILNLTAHTGWFPPVVPGTRFVTLGGAIANDIHGKNHEHSGTFGCHVRSFKLFRSNGSILDCSADSNADLFAATIGGYGLTGVVTQAEIQLKKVPSHFVLEKKTPFASLHEFMMLTDNPDSESEYSVAWIDSLASGNSLGRGVLITGNHVAHNAVPRYSQPGLVIPFTPPVPLVSGLPLRLFNLAYRWANTRHSDKQIASPQSFFFPLDAIGGWNRLYGPKGLFQHQCVLPLDCAEDVMTAMIELSQAAGQGSFLTVLKRFGSISSPGLMSFPREGYTLTLDFPNKGQKTRKLLDELDKLTIQAGGRTNPYKDARMSAETFQRGFPAWQKLEQLRDPAITSDFWLRVATRRVMASPGLQTPLQTIPVNQNAKPEIQEAEL